MGEGYDSLHGGGDYLGSAAPFTSPLLYPSCKWNKNFTRDMQESRGGFHVGPSIIMLYKQS